MLLISRCTIPNETHNSLNHFHPAGSLVAYGYSNKASPQIYTSDTILIPACMGLNLGAFRFFSRHKNNHGSSSVCVTCMYCDCERICFTFTFVHVVHKNLKTPKLSPIADDAITCGDIGSLVSLVYIYEPVRGV